MIPAKLEDPRHQESPEAESRKMNIEHRTSNIESSKGGQVLNGKR
jgi:hypothetical protein